jgi:signal transduction histidine kinase
LALNRRFRGSPLVAVQTLLGAASLALITFICLQLQLNLATAVCLYLTLVVLLSLWGSFVASAVISIIAVGCLAYFFTPPPFSFGIDDQFETIAVMLFWTTSAVITILVRRVRMRSDQLVSAERALRQAQADLAHANRVMLVGEMTSSIAHEIIQPLTAVVLNAGTCSTYLAKRSNLEEARECLALVVQNGKRAADTLRRIRALLKKVPPRKDLLDINEAIGEVIALTRNELRSNSVKLRTYLANELPLVLVDRIQLQQVIFNLLVNAIEAMNEVSDRPRELELCSGLCDSNNVFVEVRDSGPGVDVANLDLLFKSFFTTKAEGMGMGLSICRSIIENHGGRLWAKPNEPHGVVLRFTLPTQSDDRALQPTSSRS